MPQKEILRQASQGRGSLKLKTMMHMKNQVRGNRKLGLGEKSPARMGSSWGNGKGYPAREIVFFGGMGAPKRRGESKIQKSNSRNRKIKKN